MPLNGGSFYINFAEYAVRISPVTHSFKLNEQPNGAFYYSVIKTNIPKWFCVSMLQYIQQSQAPQPQSTTPPRAAPQQHSPVQGVPVDTEQQTGEATQIMSQIARN